MEPNQEHSKGQIATDKIGNHKQPFLEYLIILLVFIVLVVAFLVTQGSQTGNCFGGGPPNGCGRVTNGLSGT